MKTGFIRGWRLTGILAAAISLICLPVLTSRVIEEENVRLFIRMTARCSFVLFLSAFSASSLVTIFPGRFTKWLAQNRRYIGVSFAFSHTVHLLGILLLLSLKPHEFSNPEGLVTMIGGGLAFVFLYAMTLTSFDRTAAWIGAKPWRVLHKTGMYYFWGIFFLDYMGMTFGSLVFLPFTTLILSAVAIRIIAWRRKRARRGLERVESMARGRLARS